MQTSSKRAVNVSFLKFMLGEDVLMCTYKYMYENIHIIHYINANLQKSNICLYTLHTK